MKPKIFVLLLLLTFTASAQAQVNNAASKTNTSQAEMPEAVVNLQLDAYNLRDIDKFVATYSEDIEIYKKGVLIIKGHEQLREIYSKMFNNTPNLHCRIENRILINNKVIDKENVKANERTLEAVAIYEVIDGKIQKVTFVE